MPVYPVVVEDWQYSCCGTPFTVGETVSWQLDLAPGDLSPAEFAVSLEGDIVELERDPERRFGPPGFALCVGDLYVALPYEVRRPASPCSGVLVHEHHGGVPHELPPTSGRVEAIFVMTQRYELVGPREW